MFFSDDGGKWRQVDVLTAPHGKPGDGFGSSVAVSGTTAVAGTPFLTVGSNADSGVVYVFTSGSTISIGGGVLVSTNVAQKTLIGYNGIHEETMADFAANSWNIYKGWWLPDEA